MSAERISPAEAYAKMQGEGFTYVDVRTPEEYGAGHPAGAVNVPLDDAFVTAMKGTYTMDAPIIVGCKMGGRSARAAKALTDAGFTRVFDQSAGWDGARGPFGEISVPGWSRTDLPREPA